MPKREKRLRLSGPDWTKTSTKVPFGLVHPILPQTCGESVDLDFILALLRPVGFFFFNACDVMNTWKCTMFLDEQRSSYSHAYDFLLQFFFLFY